MAQSSSADRDFQFSVGYLSRKALPIKRNDAEPLTREDVQFDLLHHIFSDQQKVFTNQVPGQTSGSKVNFCDLYVNALYNSSKCSKVLKDKMLDTPAFAIELAKISLLTNVGRINTTMAFFPEMKTALRTYHPVPSLQKTDGNAQDAPRIKNCLKAALLPSEFKHAPPTTPEEVLEKGKAGQIPPTSVVNLIFILSTHAAPLASVHFDTGLNFLDLFLPVKISSADRARAFLWLLHRYLEGPDIPNPYDDEHSRANPGKVPWLRRLSDKEVENVDLPEEIEWGRTMSNQRNSFLQRLVSSIEQEKRNRNNPPPPPKEFTAPEVSTHRRVRPPRPAPAPEPEDAFLHYVPPDRRPTQARNSRAAQYRRYDSNPQRPDRTMLQQAWNVVTTTDPLADSDEELRDQQVRLDYNRRLNVITRLRGREPSPVDSVIREVESHSGNRSSW
ncbi:hypothetical protein PLICRDRAFT_99947 [Plicaturopsis crispa FD-325 SS-3]|nr:hypothetical protein PLICRDRAFT_99947 [Plicaturopsis crispa FD-325 SS-3]